MALFFRYVPQSLAGGNLDIARLLNAGTHARMGMQLCLESHMPELALEQSRQGAFLIAMGFASPREAPHEKLERWMRYLPARAYDNGVYVVAANQSGCSESGRDFPAVALAIAAAAFSAFFVYGAGGVCTALALDERSAVPTTFPLRCGAVPERA